MFVKENPDRKKKKNVGDLKIIDKLVLKFLISLRVSQKDIN